ncbi:hypothetical protein HDU96_000396 [Phlyctochytrium bullatum]|nr:hypothetical protein HDU96_000396 [Phlyctochytrium bullatum]
MKYILVDDITALGADLDDNYRIKVIGGGPTVDSIGYYSPARINQINPNSSAEAQNLIWGAGFESTDLEGPILNLKNNEIM